MFPKVHEFCEAAQRINAYFIRGFELVGIGALLFLMSITCIDVIGAELFLSPVFGALDIAMLAQLTAVSFAAGSALVFGKHVRVGFFLPLLPNMLRRTIRSLVLGLSLVLFFLMSWNLFEYGYSLQIHGEVSPTANIVLYPFAYGAALSFIPVCIELFISMVKNIFSLKPQAIEIT